MSEIYDYGDDYYFYFHDDNDDREPALSPTVAGKAIQYLLISYQTNYERSQMMSKLCQINGALKYKRLLRNECMHCAENVCKCLVEKYKEFTKLQTEINQTNKNYPMTWESEKLIMAQIKSKLDNKRNSEISEGGSHSK